jgi:hypothetical protein
VLPFERTAVSIPANSDLCLFEPGQTGDTPAHDASYNGHLTLFQYLVERHKIDPERRNEVRLCLFSALLSAVLVSLGVRSSALVVPVGGCSCH